MYTATHRPHPAEVHASQDQWLVGLRLHTTRTAVTWQYYVVDETPEPVDAVATAIRRATTSDSALTHAAERIADFEIRRLRRSLLGEVSLDPSTRLDDWRRPAA